MLVASRCANGVCVFAPATVLTITLERSHAGRDEVHIHPGGQGVWSARMATNLDGNPVLCTPLGGEAGDIIGPLLATEGIAVQSVRMSAENACWIHDRRDDGERRSIWESDPGELSRHESDELYSATLACALSAGVCNLAGSHLSETVIPPDLYRRLAADLRGNGVKIVADLSGAQLEAALEGGIDLLKVSDEELQREGRAAGSDDTSILAAISTLQNAGAENVVVSRAGASSLAAFGGTLYAATPPELEVTDSRGAGDSMTGAFAVGLARGLSPPDMLRLGTAAGAVNVTRHGSGTGRGDTIRELAPHVDIVALETPGR
jgi:1-phosphofructokinase